MDSGFSPRVVGRFRPDFHSLEAMLASPQFAGKEGEDFVLAVYNYLSSPVDGTYHFWPSSESMGQPRFRRANVDQIKIINNYGWAICGQMSHMLLAIWTAAGFKARSYGLPGHALCEVFYDNRWHHVDVDMWTWFRTPAGHIASAFELSQNAKALILDNKNKSSPCNLPDRDLEGYAEMCSRADVGDSDINTVRPDWCDRSHNMDFQLRPGETIIRTQENQGRFILPGDWLGYLEKFVKEWHGVPRERYGLLRTFGNGRWIYEPNLSNKYADFAAGVWEQKGIQQTEEGLAGLGHATFRIQSPHPFAGVPDWSMGRVTTSNGVWLRVEGQGDVRVEMTDPEGVWQTVFTDSGAFNKQFDVTSMMNARYDCLIRLRLGEKALLNRFRFEGFFTVAPISIPRLAQGDNPMELRTGDKHGLHTVPWRETIDFREKADLAAQWTEASNAKSVPFVKGWQAVGPLDASRPVQVVYRFAAPVGRKFGWAYFLTAHKERLADQPQGRAFTEWSLDGQDWMPLAERMISNTSANWDCSLDAELLLPDGADQVYLRITSDTAIGNVEFTGHLLIKDTPAADLVITHAWKESGTVHRFQAPASATTYSVTCGENPFAHAITMTSPSVVK